MGRCCVQLSLPEAIVQCMRHGGLQKLRLEESKGGKMSSYGKMEPEQRLVKDKGPKIDTTVFPTHVDEVRKTDRLVALQGAIKEAKTILALKRPPLTAFEQELRKLINRESMENRSDTPDFILAEYLHSCLVAFENATNARERWYGRRNDY